MMRLGSGGQAFSSLAAAEKWLKREAIRTFHELGAALGYDIED